MIKTFTLRITLFFFLFFVFNYAKADCIITSGQTINANTLLGCSGKIIIQSGGVMSVTDSPVNMPSSLDSIVVLDGGAILFGNNTKINLAANTQLVIVDINNPDEVFPGNNSQADQILIGGIPYAGGQNGNGGGVCYSLNQVVAAGGTLRPVASAAAASANAFGNVACMSSVGLASTLTGLFDNIVSATWSASPSSGVSFSPNGTSGSLGTTATVTSVGTYTFLVTIVVDVTPTNCSASSSNVTVTSDVTISFRSTPDASILGTTTVCEGGTAAQVTISNNSNPFTYFYHTSLGASGSGTSTTVLNAPTTPGTYTYFLDSVKYTDNQPGCSTSQAGETAVITVNAAPTANVTSPSCTTTVAAGTVINLTGTASTPFSWTEDGTASIANPSSLTTTYTPPLSDNGSTITFTLTSTNAPCPNATSTSCIFVRTKLPITLQSFSGTSTNCENQLNWRVSNAKSFSHFNIEGSKNGIDFRTLQKIDLTQELRDNTDDQDYSFKDKSNMRYYRLKMVDLDESFKYSQTIQVNNNCASQRLSVYPNPVFAHGKTIVDINDMGSNIKGQITDLSGKIISSITLANGTNTLQLTSLQKGVYFLKVTGDKRNEEIVKLVVSE